MFWVIGVALKDDSIGMTYVYPGVAPDANIYSRFRTIILPSVKNTHSQQFIKDSKDNPVEMAYSSIIKKVELLQPMAHSSDYVLLNPYATTNYTTTMFSPNSNEFKSLARLGSGTYWRFISTRNTEIYLQDRTVNLPHSTLSCPDEQSIDVMSINALQIIQSPCNIDSGNNQLINSPIQYSIFALPLNLNIQCHSYE